MPDGAVQGRRIHFSKWDGRAHWSCEDIVTLGVDEVGTWIGWYAGTHWERPAYGDKPGASFDAAGDQVMLLPHDRWFTMTFYERVGELALRTYTDITTVPRLVGDLWTVVDLDLDVIEPLDGDVTIDDEDEFAEHSVEFGYPPRVIAAATAECDRVLEEICSGAPVFAESVAAHWRSVLRARRAGLAG